MVGATIYALTAEGNINPHQCDQLSGYGAIRHSAAIRPAQPIHALTMPSTPITVIEGTSSLIDLLSVVAQPVASSDETVGGVWLSADLAATLGVAPGDRLPTTDGSALVQGTYMWPTDGRDRSLGYTMVVPVAEDGEFSQCWVDLWPMDETSLSLAYAAVNRPNPDANLALTQLNTSRGASLDGVALMEHRLTARAPWAGAIVGFAVGWISVRLRRLEIASAFHARIRRVDVTCQHLIEAVCWAAVAAVVVAASLLWGARLNNPDLSWSVWWIAMRSVLAAAAAVPLGVAVGVMFTREKYLFRYAKDR
jgi:hypothetical protein